MVGRRLGCQTAGHGATERVQISTSTVLDPPRNSLLGGYRALPTRYSRRHGLRTSVPGMLRPSAPHLGSRAARVVTRFRTKLVGNRRSHLY